MTEIKDLLAKYSQMLFGEESRVEAVMKAVKEVCGFDIKKEEIKIKSGTIYLNTKPIYKNQIYLKKEAILNKLKEELKEKTPKNIR